MANLDFNFSLLWYQMASKAILTQNNFCKRFHSKINIWKSHIKNWSIKEPRISILMGAKTRQKASDLLYVIYIFIKNYVRFHLIVLLKLLIFWHLLTTMRVLTSQFLKLLVLTSLWNCEICIIGIFLKRSLTESIIPIQ